MGRHIMTVTYVYGFNEYPTEEDAQAQVAITKVRLENNPTDWCVVKEIQENDNGTFVITPDKLSDDEINNPDISKRYLAYSIPSSGNFMNLSSVELREKVIEYRAEYARHQLFDVIIKQERDADGDIISTENITLNVDMSGYVE
jgi:hypothetical protein